MTTSAQARAALKWGDRVAILDAAGKLVAVEMVHTKLATLIKTSNGRHVWHISTGAKKTGHRTDGGIMIRKATKTEATRWDLEQEIARAAYRAKSSAETVENVKASLTRAQRQVTECEEALARCEPLAQADQERLDGLRAKLAARDAQPMA